MKVLKVAPKDVYVTFEISFADLKKVVDGISIAKMEYDGKGSPELAVGAVFVKTEFYPMMLQVVEDLEKEGYV